MAKRLRLDAELVRRGLVDSRTAAQSAIERGLVTVRGVPTPRAATLVESSASITLTENPSRFVSRGGEKLDGALARLDLDIHGRWVDAGASTGGFTDCLLQRGASAVAAVDVGYGQLDWTLRNDERVVVIERTNVRELTPQDVPWPADGVVADLSFISLRVVFPALSGIARDDALFVVLVKPQFEVGRNSVGKGGVVRDPQLWRRAVVDVIDAARGLGLNAFGITHSDPPGPAGNREFFVALSSERSEDLSGLDPAIAAAEGLV